MLSLRPIKPNCLILLATLILPTGCELGVGAGKWTNPHDPEGTNYHPPMVTLNDTAIRNAETGRLKVHAKSDVSTVSSIAWTLDDSLLSTTDSILNTSGWSDGPHIVSARATDATGLVGPTQTVHVWIGNQPPNLQKIEDVSIASTAPFQQILSATDPDGTISDISWDVIPDQYSQTSSLVTLDPILEGGNRTIYWRATDNEGKTAYGSFTINALLPPTISMEPDLAAAGITSAIGMNNNWTVSARGSIVIPALVSIDSPNSTEDKLTLKVTDGRSPLTCITSSYGGPSSLPYGKHFRCTPASSAQTTNYLSYSASVTDQYGRSTQASFSITINRRD